MDAASSYKADDSGCNQRLPIGMNGTLLVEHLDGVLVKIEDHVLRQMILPTEFEGAATDK